MTAVTAARAATQLDEDNPWPGLQSFEENARAYFFGRDDEIELLCARVLDAPATVLYGRSGLGKTSLLQAGLFPLLREHNFLPIHVRFDLKPGAAGLTRQLHQSVANAIRAEVPDAVLPADQESVWEYLHRTDFELWSAQNYPLTPVIVLDQFEELFTLGKQVPDLVDDFRDELGDLAENRIPADLAARIDKHPPVAERFNLRSRKYRLLISLREDFLPDLEAWCRLIPALGRSRVRLLPLRANEALDAVHKPAAHLMTRELARRVVRTIAGQELRRRRGTVSPNAGITAVHPGNQLGKAEVEPALLSLFCRELNQKRKQSGQGRFDEQLLENAERDVLSNFYESCVRDLEPQVAVFIEEKLITESGFRNNYVREDAVPAYLTEDELDQLIRSRLLRLEDRYGAQRIELTHDVLTGVVREHRDARRAEEKVAEQAEQERQAIAHAAEQHAAELDRDRLLERERRLASERVGRRLKWFSAVLVVVCVAAVATMWVALHYKNQADASAREATATGLYGDSLKMLAGMSPNGSDDVAVMQKVLAAHAIPSNKGDGRYELLTVLNRERDLLKIIDMPAVVTSVAFSPDGTRIAVGSADHSVQLWSTDGQPIGSPLRHDAAVSSVAFSPDGTRIATGSADNTLRLWDADTQQAIGKPMRHEDWVNCVAFSPDGTRIASAGADKTVRLWDTRTQQQVGEPLRHDDQVTNVAFSPDGTRIATASIDNTIRLWDADGKPVGQPLRYDGWVNGIAFSPDGTRIATASADKTVRLWDTRTMQQVGDPLQHPDAVMGVAFSPDGARIATAGYDKTVRLWDPRTGQPVGVLSGHEAPVIALAFSSDSRHLVSAGGDTDGTVRLWDTGWQPMLGHKGTAWATFFDDGRQIGSGGNDNTVRWWDAGTGRPIGEPVRIDDSDVDFVFPLNHDRVLSLGSVDTVRLWDAHTRKPIGAPLRVESSGNVVADDTSNPRIAVPLEPGVVQVYTSDTMRPVGKRIRPAGGVWTMSFSPDGRILATGGFTGEVELWNSSTGERIGHSMKGHGDVTSIAFSRDGGLLAAGHSDYTLQLWDTGTSQPVGRTMHLDSVSTNAAFSPDASAVASGGDDGTIQLFDAGDQSPLSAPLDGDAAVVNSLYYSPDGTKLLSAGENGTLRLWPAPPPTTEAARDALCTKLTHNMSQEQWDEWVSKDIDYKDGCPNLPESDHSG